MLLIHFFFFSSFLLHCPIHQALAPPIISIRRTCSDTCGTIPVKFPFGTGPGCGHPDFARYVKCSSGSELQLSTSSGTYQISSINYTSNAVVVSDPLMSTCAAMQNSGSFVLDRASPFAVSPDNVFVLLGCSATSPVFDPDEGLCEAPGRSGSGSGACVRLYSCKGIRGIGLGANAPVSTCCSYRSPTSTGLGSGYRLDLPKMQCSSYSSIYGFGSGEEDPEQWEFGISLRYDASYARRSSACMDCEADGGACGYEGVEESFACVCRDGQSTTARCSGLAWSGGGAWGPTRKFEKSITSAYLLLWTVLFIVSG